MGGVENYVANLSHQLKSDGFGVVVIASALRGKSGIEDEDGVIGFHLPSILLMHDCLPIVKRNAEVRSMR